MDNNETESQFIKQTESMMPPRVGERIEYVGKKGGTNVAKVTGRTRK